MVPAAVKVEFINRLSQTGLKTIEATSFVSPKWIPQLADAAEVFKGIEKKSGVAYPVLVPNEKGMQRALAAGAKEVSTSRPPPKPSTGRTSTAPSPNPSSASSR